MKIITIDTGMTNSRIYLIDNKNNQINDVVKKNVGVKNTAVNGSVGILKNKLSYGIEEIFQRNGCTYQDIYYIVAAGMITTNLGLVEVSHIASPCDIKDFATSSVVKILPEFFNIPCNFYHVINIVKNRQMFENVEIL
ncbi:2-dehydro-3-deoxygalactonokinase [Niallia sp. JL1B1071]|uniref:2-dehydro-3-deoxygalactonokinase n=1 Tax=Niallia tiangongensis TaxID=3237105 RepID=UPI0037DD71BA